MQLSPIDFGVSFECLPILSAVPERSAASFGRRCFVVINVAASEDWFDRLTAFILAFYNERTLHTFFRALLVAGIVCNFLGFLI